MRVVPVIAGTVLVALLPVNALRAQSFDGPYVGAQAGWQGESVRDPVTGIGPIALDDDRDAFTGGVFVGYDRQVAPRIVVGAEAGADIAADDAIESATATINPDWSFDLSARAGYLADPATLLYVRGGYTNARVETSASTLIGRLSESENRDGWLAGAGIEREILPRLSTRVEYRYSDLGEGDGKWDRHRVLAGIVYRF